MDDFSRPSLTNRAMAFNPNAAPFRPRQQFEGSRFPVYPSCTGTQDSDTNAVHAFAPTKKIDEIGGAQQFILSPDLFERMIYSSNATLLQEVQVGLEQLVYQPSEFETWSRAIRDRLIDKSMTPSSLSVVAQILLQMATLAPAVQYNFGRLCAFLCDEVDDFRQQCLLPAMRDYHEKQRLLMTPSQQQNLLLFFAEVYENLQLANGCHLDVLGIAVYEQLRNMLDANDIVDSGAKICDSSIKVVVQVLKLCGRHLESMEDGRSNVDELLTKLNVYATAHRGLSEPVRHQIKGLASLRESCWGMKDLEKFKANPGNLPSTSSSGLICGPDGQPLSDEERAFLEENFGKLDSGPADENDLSDEYDDFLTSDETRQLDEMMIKGAEDRIRGLTIKDSSSSGRGCGSNSSK